MCDIEIFPPTGIDEFGNTIGVAGTVSDCPEDPIEGTNVTVEVTCGEESAQRNAEVFSDGRWYAEFPNLDCRCGLPVTATATCTTAPDCEETIEVEELACIDCSGQETDDDVLSTLFQVGDHECLVNGNARVPIEFTFTNTLGEFVHIVVECGPDAVAGGPTVGIPSGTTTTETIACEFPTPTEPQEVVIWFLDQDFDPIGCPPVVLTVDEIEKCPCQTDAKPDIDVQVNGCDATFTRTELPHDECTLIWNFDDGSNSVTDDDVTVTHEFPENGTYDVAVAMECGDCIYPIAVSPVEITDCEQDDVDTDDETDDDTVVDDGDGGISFRCWIFGLLWVLALAAFLTLIAVGAPASAIATAAGVLGTLLYFVIDACGFCVWARFTLAGVAVFLVALVALVIAGGAPNWWQALVAALGFVISAVVAISERC